MSAVFRSLAKEEAKGQVHIGPQAQVPALPKGAPGEAQESPRRDQGDAHPTTWSMAAKIWFRTSLLAPLRLPVEVKKENSSFSKPS